MMDCWTPAQIIVLLVLSVFERKCEGFYPQRETYEDKLADRVVLIVSVLVVVLILIGVLR